MNAGSGAKLPASDFISLHDLVLCGWQNCLVKARFIGNQPKWHWCHYSFAITMCNQHLLHNDMWKTKKKVQMRLMSVISSFVDSEFLLWYLHSGLLLAQKFSSCFPIIITFSCYYYSDFHSKSWLKCAVGIHVKMVFIPRCRVFWQTWVPRQD